MRTPSIVCVGEGARVGKEVDLWGSLDPVGAIGAISVRTRIDCDLLPR